MNRHVTVLIGTLAWLSIGPVTAASATPPTMTMAEALAAALQENPTMAAVMQDSAVARSRVREPRADLYPSLSASGTYTRHQEPNLVQPIHQAGVFPPLDEQIYEGRLQLRASVFDGGRRRAQVRATAAGAAAAAARLERGRGELIEGVARVYVEARLLDGGLDLVAARSEVLRERRRELTVLLAEGRAAPADLALVASALAEALADSLDLASQRQQAAIRLGLWTGTGGPIAPQVAAARPAPAAAGDGPSLAEAAPPGSGPAAPAVREATALVEQSAAWRSAAARAFWPELSVFALLQSAVVAIYLVLLAQFRSFLHPLTVMAAIPLTLIGSAGALLIAGKTVSMPVMIGQILLVGIVVNNSIILIDDVRQRRARGRERRDALREAVRTRFRPIMMTSLSTIVGMTPLAMEWALGAERFSPLAIAVMGGLTAGTLLTMIVVPVLYDSLDSLRVRLVRSPAGSV